MFADLVLEVDDVGRVGRLLLEFVDDGQKVVQGMDDDRRRLRPGGRDAASAAKEESGFDEFEGNP